MGIFMGILWGFYGDFNFLKNFWKEYVDTRSLRMYEPLCQDPHLVLRKGKHPLPDLNQQINGGTKKVTMKKLIEKVCWSLFVMICIGVCIAGSLMITYKTGETSVIIMGTVLAAILFVGMVILLVEIITTK